MIDAPKPDPVAIARILEALAQDIPDNRDHYNQIINQWGEVLLQFPVFASDVQAMVTWKPELLPHLMVSIALRGIIIGSELRATQTLKEMMGEV